MIKLFFLLAFVSLSFAHVCLLFPPQRGTANNLNTAGSVDCGLFTAPCGGRPQQTPDILLPAGGNVTIVFQKNLNHYQANNPGKFRITYEKPGQHGSFKLLKEIPDTDSPSLTLYSETVTLPTTPSDHALIGVQYISNGPPEFYQCSDIVLGKV
eukprot:TRINITY_DN584_c0_g1_i2.p1 TRINITY_DN584_c0_g1~~TRINITY_DN584_c0_g1_i2.p1  ORF type:complete len:165 (-),score=36.96 TRINITY_DN584_c0_g1_i2:59-520(-)